MEHWGGWNIEGYSLEKKKKANIFKYMKRHLQMNLGEGKCKL